MATLVKGVSSGLLHGGRPIEITEGTRGTQCSAFLPSLEAPSAVRFWIECAAEMHKRVGMQQRKRRKALSLFRPTQLNAVND